MTYLHEQPSKSVNCFFLMQAGLRSSQKVHASAVKTSAQSDLAKSAQHDVKHASHDVVALAELRRDVTQTRDFASRMDAQVSVLTREVNQLTSDVRTILLLLQTIGSPRNELVGPHQYLAGGVASTDLPTLDRRYSKDSDALRKMSSAGDFSRPSSSSSSSAAVGRFSFPQKTGSGISSPDDGGCASSPSPLIVGKLPNSRGLELALAQKMRLPASTVHRVNFIQLNGGGSGGGSVHSAPSSAGLPPVIEQRRCGVGGGRGGQTSKSCGGSGGGDVGGSVGPTSRSQSCDNVSDIGCCRGSLQPCHVAKCGGDVGRQQIGGGAFYVADDRNSGSGSGEETATVNRRRKGHESYERVPAATTALSATSRRVGADYRDSIGGGGAWTDEEFDLASLKSQHGASDNVVRTPLTRSRETLVTRSRETLLLTRSGAGRGDSGIDVGRPEVDVKSTLLTTDL